LLKFGVYTMTLYYINILLLHTIYAWKIFQFSRIMRKNYQLAFMNEP